MMTQTEYYQNIIALSTALNSGDEALFHSMLDDLDLRAFVERQIHEILEGLSGLNSDVLGSLAPVFDVSAEDLLQQLGAFIAITDLDEDT
jgi:hypothetical protein